MPTRPSMVLLVSMSYKILSIKGIDIELHLFFIIFILSLLILDPLTSFFLIIIFVFVALHELSHSLVAMRNGIKVKKIVLLPIGGVAMIDNVEMKPLSEIKMALAGPLFNFLVVYLLLFLAYIFQLPLVEWIKAFSSGNISLLQMLYVYVLYANLILGAFNLFVPAFPLDGGRILRAVLALKMDYLKATDYARKISLIIAAIMFVLAFHFGDLWIMIITFFIALGAVGEYEATLIQHSLKSRKVSELLTSDFILLKASDPVATALYYMIMRDKKSCLVRYYNRFFVLEIKDVLRVPRSRWLSTAVVNVAKPAFILYEKSSFEEALRHFKKTGLSMLPVLRDDGSLSALYFSDLQSSLEKVKG